MRALWGNVAKAVRIVLMVPIKKETTEYRPGMYATGVTKWPDQVTRQRSRMRESCTSGSVRGVSSDRRLYSTLLARSPLPPKVERSPISEKQVSGPCNHLDLLN